jgi:hypothetical protein
MMRPLGSVRAYTRAVRAAAARLAAPAAVLALAAALVTAGPAAAAAPGATAAAVVDAGGRAIPQRPVLPVLNDLHGPLARNATRRLPMWSAPFAALPGAAETAAFAAGSMAVAVIFVESDGSIDRDREKWSRRDPDYPGDRRANVLDKVSSALAWWNERSPDASLEVFLPAAGEYGAPRTVTTGYEPITRPVSDFDIDYRLSDAGWRWQIMKKLGYSHDAEDDSPVPERVYADKVRRSAGTDWAFVLYVVDSLKDRDGMFPGGAVAYTDDLYGPYTVLTYDNDGYGFENFEAVLAHEMGHVFGALDEYAPPYSGYPSTGALVSGYLGVRNRNAVKGGTTDLPCIMRGSQETLDAFAYGDLCTSSVGQTGLRDTDADLRPDVVATRPLFETGAAVPLPGGRVTLGGTVREQPWPHGYSTVGPRFTRDISIFVPHDLQYRVDGGDWLPLTPLDGAFDRPSEKWTLTTPALAAGAHALEVRGTTGETAGFTLTVVAGP